MGKLSTMPNIGETLEKRLIEVGIDSSDLLIKTGSREAFIKLKLADATVCFNMLCAIEGAVRGIRWHYLPEEVKGELRSFYENLA